ncbi:MAG: uracil-DNA glycosylase [Beijerinckiaceae bacterium]|nr:uracil-DNA glycosylase [Beijerinckiaceae bacterium]
MRQCRLAPGPDLDCPLCPRLAKFRSSLRTLEPEWHNAPVPSFGGHDARLLIVGLAPGLRGANRTGRPFTGDFAGDLLYETLIDFGFAAGEYGAARSDGLRLVSCMITNAVRCVPPQNKPASSETSNCRQFLMATIAALAELRVIMALGRVAHDSVLRAAGVKPAAFPFAHGAEQVLGASLATAQCRSIWDHKITLIDSYHCSRYNINTGVLTRNMFREVFAKARDKLRCL